jgi:DNA-binding MarR family transcriptional regulator
MQPSTAPCICFRVRRASRSLTRLYDDALAPAGLTVTQFSILRNSRRLDGPTVSELADYTGHERTALWRTLQPLVREGLIELLPGADKRAHRIRITPAGETAVKRAEPLWAESQGRVAALLGEDKQRQLVALLKEVESLGV